MTAMPVDLAAVRRRHAGDAEVAPPSTPHTLPVPPLTSTLRAISHQALTARRASTGAGVTLLTTTGRRITSVGSDRVAERVNALHDACQDGPFADAWTRRRVVRVPDITANAAGAWTARARDLGLRSVLAAPLATADRLLGVLAVWAPVAGAYDERDAAAFERFARSAAALIDVVQTTSAAHFPVLGL